MESINNNEYTKQGMRRIPKSKDLKGLEEKQKIKKIKEDVQTIMQKAKDDIVKELNKKYFLVRKYPNQN